MAGACTTAEKSLASRSAPTGASRPLPSRARAVDHSDSLGAQARFGRGDVQWMTAGSGIVHSEMFPLVNAEERNPAELFQIWLNLPAKSKMVPPYFTMIWSEQIQRVVQSSADGGDTVISVVAGELGDARGAATPPDSWAADPSHGSQRLSIRMTPGANGPSRHPPQEGHAYCTPTPPRHHGR